MPQARGRSRRSRRVRRTSPGTVGRICPASSEVEHRPDRLSRWLGDSSESAAFRRLQCQVPSGNAHVAGLGGQSPLFLGQVRLSDGSHEAPVPSHWAALEPPPAKTDRLQGSPRNPKRGEQVPSSAPHRRIGPDHKATTAHHHDGLHAEQEGDHDHDDLSAHCIRVRQRIPDRSLRCRSSGQAPPWSRSRCSGAAWANGGSTSARGIQKDQDR